MARLVQAVNITVNRKSKMNTITNISQFPTSGLLQQKGVVDVENRDELTKILAMPPDEQMQAVDKIINKFVTGNSCKKFLVGGPLWIVIPLVDKLKDLGRQPMVAWNTKYVSNDNKKKLKFQKFVELKSN